jgi:hypothetical protein
LKNRDPHPEFNFNDDEEPAPQTNAYARRSDPKSSHEAAERVSATALELEVYKTLKEQGRPMTSLCVVRIMKKPAWSISPRFKPLERKGLIERVGTMVVLNSNGKPRQLTAWRVKQ